MKYIYNKNVGVPGSIVVEARPLGGKEAFELNVEMTVISRFVWKLGAAANEVYNAIPGCGVKFQSAEISKNILRARLLTKIWRQCKKEEIEINSETFWQRHSGREVRHKLTEDFDEIMKIIRTNARR